MPKSKKVKLNTPEERTAFWTEQANKKYVGRKIVAARYMTAEESEALMWDGGKAIVLVLDNGDYILPSSDEEGNGPGVLFSNKNSIIPVL